VSDRGALLVTGGAGFVGSHFVRLAVEAGRTVVVLDDLSGGEPAPMPRSTALVVGDIGDRRLVEQIVRDHGVTAVAHFAGKIQVGESVSEPHVYFDVNVVRSLGLLAALRDACVEAFLFSSTAAVYGPSGEAPLAEGARREPENPYGATKLCVELALEAWHRAYGTKWAALRYFNAAGAHPDGTLRECHEPETHLIPLVVDAGLRRAPAVRIFGSDYSTPDGTCVRDFVHVMDLAEAHLSALLRLEAGDQLGPINLGTGRGSSVSEVLAVTSELLGNEVPHRLVDRRAGDPSFLVADPTRAAELLGWRPRRSDLRSIIEDTLRSRRALRAGLRAHTGS
jgi:UDP-glucose-4-epimerase GalE